MIPKVIHHFAPNEDKWHPIWKICIQSWYIHYPKDHYEHRFWNDNDVTKFVNDEYPQYKKIYDKLPLHIMKLDFARYLVIHKFGGLYVDMDMFCYKNFYQILNKNIILLEALDKKEITQNSMFGGTVNNDFYIACVENSIYEYEIYKEQLLDLDINDNKKIDFLVQKITSCYNLSKVYYSYDKTNIQLLDKKRFNPFILYYDDILITKHIMTGLWGKEVIDTYERIDDEYSSVALQKLINKKSINFLNFDFYKNYYENTKTLKEIITIQ